MIRPVKEREKKIGTALYYTAFSLLIALCVGFITFMFVHHNNLQVMIKASEENLKKLQYDLAPDNIDKTNEAYLLRALQSSSSPFNKDNRLPHMLSNLWSYKFYITVGTGEDAQTELLNPENAGLSGISEGQRVVITLRESMDYTYLPLNVALKGRLYSDDPNDDIASFMGSADNIKAAYNSSQSRDENGKTSITSSLSFEFLYETDKVYSFNIMLLMHSRLSDKAQQQMLSADSLLYYKLSIG